MVKLLIIKRGLYEVCTTSSLLGSQKLPLGADSGRGLGWQGEIELSQEELVVGQRLGVAGKEQPSAVSGGEAGIDHLDGGELFQDGA